MTRRLLTLLTAVTVLAVPAGATAADKTLLSGYGAPGGGEQSKLGGKLLPAPRGNGSLRASTPAGASPSRGSAPATSAPAAGGPETSAPAAGGPATGGPGDGATSTGRPGAEDAAGAAAGAKSRRQGPGDARRGTGKSADAPAGAGRGSTPASGAVAAAGAEPVSYPTADDSGTLPVGGSDTLLLLLGLVTLALAGAATYGLTRTPPRRLDSNLL